MTAKDSWAHRLARMHPRHSKMEYLVWAQLKAQAPSVRILTDKAFCLQSTTPDFYMPDSQLAVYLDGPVHRGRQLDRDHHLRDLLQRRHRLHVIAVPYTSTSHRSIVEVSSTVLEAIFTYRDLQEVI